MLIRSSTLLLLVAALLVSPAMLRPPKADACTCARAEIEEQVANAELIVLGTVLEIVEVETEPNSFPIPYDLTVEVDDYLKGEGSGQVVVRDMSSLQSSACSAFDRDSVGLQYLLFLVTRDDGSLGTSVCSGSAAVDDSAYWQERIEEVRQITSGAQETATPQARPVDLQVTPTSVPPDLPPVGSGDTSGGDSTLLISASVVAGLLGLAGLGLAVRRGVLRG